MEKMSKWCDFLLFIGIALTIHTPEITIFSDMALWLQNFIFAIGMFCIALVLASIRKSVLANRYIAIAFIICCILAGYYFLITLFNVMWEVPRFTISEVYHFVIYELFSQDSVRPAYLNTIWIVIRVIVGLMVVLKLVMYQCMAVSCYRWMKVKGRTIISCLPLVCMGTVWVLAFLQDRIYTVLVNHFDDILSGVFGICWYDGWNTFVLVLEICSYMILFLCVKSQMMQGTLQSFLRKMKEYFQLD